MFLFVLFFPFFLVCCNLNHISKVKSLICFNTIRLQFYSILMHFQVEQNREESNKSKNVCKKKGQNFAGKKKNQK